MEKLWKVYPKLSQDVFSQYPEIDPLLLQLLSNRGIKEQKDVDEFLNADWLQDVHDPNKFRDMLSAVDIVYKSIARGDKITVYADYDADGVTGGTILVSALKKLGATVNVYIPHREREGYGLNQAALRYIADSGAKLIITCDCGVANVDEVKIANDLGMQVIITDHHEPKETLPPAVAIIHPTLPGENYPGKYLSGGAVAFKLVQGLIKSDQCKLSSIEKESLEKWTLDLVAISLVADMIPLTGEARTLTKYGLVVLQKNKRLGLQKLLSLAGIDPATINTTTIGWQIAPRINAAGRMDHANTGFALLMSENESEADELAQALNSANIARQKATEEMITEAAEQVGEKVAFLVTAYKREWSIGLVGLVAGKLVQLYNRPALVMCFDGKEVVGSGRGLPGFDLVDALGECSELLTKFGGHKQAAGFRLPADNLAKFIKKISAYAKKILKDIDLKPELDIDIELSLKDANWHLYDTVKSMEPYGQGNSMPLFLSPGLKVIDSSPVGSTGQHRRLVMAGDNIEKKFILFNMPEDKIIKNNDIIDVVYEIGVNEWNGNRDLQLKIKDYKINE